MRIYKFIEEGEFDLELSCIHTTYVIDPRNMNGLLRADLNDKTDSKRKKRFDVLFNLATRSTEGNFEVTPELIKSLGLKGRKLTHDERVHGEQIRAFTYQPPFNLKDYPDKYSANRDWKDFVRRNELKRDLTYAQAEQLAFPRKIKLIISTTYTAENKNGEN